MTTGISRTSTVSSFLSAYHHIPTSISFGSAVVVLKTGIILEYSIIQKFRRPTCYQGTSRAGRPGLRLLQTVTTAQCTGPQDGICTMQYLRGAHHLSHHHYHREQTHRDFFDTFSGLGSSMAARGALSCLSTHGTERRDTLGSIFVGAFGRTRRHITMGDDARCLDWIKKDQREGFGEGNPIQL